MDLNTFTVIIGLSIPFLLMTLWAVINAANKEFGSLSQKAIWMIIAAIPFIGFVIYLIFGFRRGKKHES